ncbi:hypothetical protein [Streptomyces sp. NPDC101234]
MVGEVAFERMRAVGGTWQRLFTTLIPRATGARDKGPASRAPSPPP